MKIGKGAKNSKENERNKVDKNKISDEQALRKEDKQKKTKEEGKNSLEEEKNKKKTTDEPYKVVEDKKKNNTWLYFYEFNLKKSASIDMCPCTCSKI